MENLLSSGMEKLHTKCTLGKSTGYTMHKMENYGEYMDGKIILDIRKTFGIYRHRNNCGGIVYGKIVGCLRKNICIVVVNASATEKGVVKLR